MKIVMEEGRGMSERKQRKREKSNYFVPLVLKFTV